MFLFWWLFKLQNTNATSPHQGNSSSSNNYTLGSGKGLEKSPLDAQWSHSNWAPPASFPQSMKKKSGDGWAPLSPSCSWSCCSDNSLAVAAKFKKVERTFPGLSLHSLNRRRRYNNKRKAERKEEFPSAKYFRRRLVFLCPLQQETSVLRPEEWGHYSDPWVEQTAFGAPTFLQSHQASLWGDAGCCPELDSWDPLNWSGSGTAPV